MSAESVRIQINDESGVTRAILETTRMCHRLGLREDLGNRAATAVSELARNIVKYAGSGQIVIQRREAHRAVGIEIVASDSGPGIENVEKALEDHFSSSGTLGLGLPGVRRLMDEFKLESKTGEGTRVTALLWG